MQKMLSLFAVCALSLPVTAGEGAAVPALDPAGLQQTLKAGKWAVVEFGGATCKPCKEMQPILAEVQKQFGDKVIVRNFYPAQHKEAARPYKIMVWPTQVVFNPSGKEVLRHMGVWPKAAFVQALNGAGLK